jgi:adenylate cyclase
MWATSSSTGTTFYGDGVNIAARLEGIAAPGGIAISEDALRQVQGKVQANFVDLGNQTLKNIASPIRVYRVETGTEIRAAPAVPKLALPDKPSIAVLPFTNMSGDPEQEYFADGMVEDIITGLSRIRWLFVIARNSSFTYKGKTVDVKQVGRELGVRYVLEGSVRKAGNRVRITGQLTEAESGAHLWAERYDRDLTDIFAVQDEITVSVVGSIEPSVRRAEIERVKRKRPENLDAYDLALRALPHANAAMPNEAAVALPLLERALVLQPDYSFAHGLSAWCYEVRFVRAGNKPADREAGIRHGRAALAFGADDANALALGGFALSMLAHDGPAALDAFDRALSLSPSSFIALSYRSVALALMGKGDLAVERAAAALRLSPFDPMRFAPHMGATVAHFFAGRWEEAAAAARRTIEANPSFSTGYAMLAGALANLGRTAETKAAANHLLEMEPDFTIRGLTALAYTDEARATWTAALAAAGLPP